MKISAFSLVQESRLLFKFLPIYQLSNYFNCLTVSYVQRSLKYCFQYFWRFKYNSFSSTKYFYGRIKFKIYSMNILTSCIQIHRNLINVNSVHIFISWCRESSLQRETSEQERFFFISIFFHVLICSDRHEWNIISISFHSQRRIRNFKDIFWQIFDLELVNTPLIALFLRYLSKFIGLGIFFFFFLHHFLSPWLSVCHEFGLPMEYA